MSQRGHGTLGAIVGAVLGVLMLGPALLPGYTLHYDLVFVPDLPFSARTLGADGAVPRAMPNDLVVAVLSLLLPGWVVQKAILLGALVVAGAGAARLARTRPGAVAAAVVFVWNAWVGQRIGIGHWGFLIGFAMLPWVLTAATRVAEGGGARGLGRARWLLLGTVTVAALGGSTSGVLATFLAVVALVVGGRDRRARLIEPTVVLLGSLVVNASWWWPFLTAASRAADPAGVSVFSARADTPFGVLGSALLGGALWNERMWFAERETLVGAGVALVATLTVLALTLGRRAWWSQARDRAATVAGGAGLLLAVAASTGPGERAVAWLVETAPGAGLLRDSQKFLALLVLLVAAASADLGDRLADRRVGLPVLACLVAWPLATLPSLAAGHVDRWGSVGYPDAVTSTAAAVDQAPGEGSLLVLPWMTYRSYPWNDARVVLDPWNRLVARDVVSNDALPVGGRVVAGEDPRAERVGRLLAEGSAPDAVAAGLRELGVRYVLVDASQPTPEGTMVELDGALVHEAGDLRLVDVGVATNLPARDFPVGLVVSGAGALGVLLGLLRGRRDGSLARGATRR